MYDPRSGNSLGESPCDLISLLEWTPKVEEVTLEGNELYNKDMDSIARHCPHITTLTLVNMYNITDDALKQFGYLSSLTLKNCRRLTNRALLNVKNCSHITTFTLVKMHKITDDALELFDHLSSLTLKECIQLTSHAILNVKHCPLVSLCLEGDLQSIEVLFGQTLSSLSLTTYYHRQLTIPPIQDSLLKKLCLDGFGSKETPINGIILQRFVEAHSQLEVLELRWCKVKYDLVAWNLKNLRRLYLDCRWGLPIVWLEKMIVACPRLVYIHSDFPAKFTWEQDDISKVRLGIAPLTYNNCLPVSSGLV
ncbi:hypothetical protein BC941DRAFT_456678 [Chlamydoabsidia padenii]|nr:hypothetical protein BC941DRAFT_456678 [Chlamydoabsidia padenii]